MPCRIEPYVDHPTAREELAGFLADQFADGPDASLWAQRLAHWWDENPIPMELPNHGWVLRHEGRLVGFQGMIPTRYGYQGKPVSALIATSWVVVAEHRNAAVPMGLRMHKLGKVHLLLDTTPSEEVQALISRMGWTGETRARRVIVPLGMAGKLLARRKERPWPVLTGGRRITTDVSEVKRLVRPWQQEGRVEKWNTPEVLRWYAAAPARMHQFVGVVDDEGTLTSFLWLTPRRRMGMTVWTLLEAFSTEAENHELEAMVGALVRREVALPGARALLLFLMSFPNDTRWADMAGFRQQEVHVCHFHLAPPGLLNKAKHTVLAEGDFGL